MKKWLTAGIVFSGQLSVFSQGGEFCRGALRFRFLLGEEIGLVGRRAPRIEGRRRVPSLPF